MLTAKLESPATTSTTSSTRFGEVQARYQDLGGYELEARAQEILHGLGFHQEQMRQRRRHAVGRLEDARRARARSCSRSPSCCCSTSRRTTSTSSRSCGSRRSCATTPGTVVMTCHDREIMNRVVGKIVEIDGGELRTLRRQLRLLRDGARDRGGAPRGRVRAPAGDAREGEPVHRAVQDPRREGRAGAEPDEEARQDREDRRAARGSSRRRFEFRAPPRSGDDVVRSTRCEGVRRARRPRRPHADRRAARSAGR